MGKYEILGNFLKNQRKNRMTLAFKEIENMLNFNLPNSSKSYRAWWANDPYHVQAYDGWLKFGFNVENVNFKEETVHFIRTGINKSIKTKESTKSNLAPRSKAYEFERKSGEILSKYFNEELSPGQVDGIHKLFDFVSKDGSIIGDAKYFTLVHGKSLPPAKFSVIAEHTWLLEKTKAKRKFLVFGNDRRVPEEWLKRYGNLVKNIEFYFIDDKNNTIERLN